jgi:hypothetical protein
MKYKMRRWFCHRLHAVTYEEFDEFTETLMDALHKFETTLARQRSMNDFIVKTFGKDNPKVQKDYNDISIQ